MVGVAAVAAQHRRMRYEPSQRLLRLALTLAGTRTGLTLDEIAQELEVGRRTAERLRDSLAGLFPQLEAWDDEERVRRWRLPGGALAGVAEPRAEAVAAVEALARECASRGELDRAGLLREAATTLRALMRPAALLRAEPDIETLMQAEGIAMRPGPRPRLNPAILPTLRRAILGVQLVVIRYAAQDMEKPVARVLCPYGTLYGGDGRAWLVGHVEELPDMRLWRLDRIALVDLLDRCFVRREDFDLRAYAAQSFGVFQEEPIDVVLRIAPEAAAEAACWQFHPTQTVEREVDGALLVRFRAGGMQEMCWHLFTWGAAITVVASNSLRHALTELAGTVVRHYDEILPKRSKAEEER
jgi:predicted DNA-binding transcriptional regulator YafY